MGVFEKVEFEWGGKKYAIQPEGMLRVICEVEGVITLAEITRHLSANTWPTAKLAAGLGIMLRAAGAAVIDEDVYSELFTDGEQVHRAFAALTALQVLMIPPQKLREALAKRAVVEKNAAGTTVQ